MLVIFLLIARKCYKSSSCSSNSGPYYCSQETFSIRCFKLCGLRQKRKTWMEF